MGNCVQMGSSSKAGIISDNMITEMKQNWAIMSISSSVRGSSISLDVVKILLRLSKVFMLSMMFCLEITRANCAN